MNLLKKVREKAGVDEVERRLEQRRAALTQEIENALQEKNWDRSDLAEAMGKKPSQITRLLKRGANPTLRTLAEVEAALGRELFTVNRNIKFKLKNRHLREGQVVISQSGEHGNVSGSVEERARAGDMAGKYESVRENLTLDSHSTSGNA